MADDTSPILEIQPVPIPVKRDPVQRDRRIRQRDRTNRAPSNKGILVNITDNIQHAINDVSKNGGGIVHLKTGIYPELDYDVVVPDNVTLQGEGRQNTVLDFAGNAFGVKIVGSSGDTRNSVAVKDIAIINSGAEAGLDIFWAEDVLIEGVVAFSCTNQSFRLQGSRFVTYRDCISDESGSHGFSAVGLSGRSSINVSYYSCISQSSTGNGFAFTTGASAVLGNLYLFACRANLGATSSSDGFDFSGQVQMDGAVVACIAASNAGKGYDVDAQNISFLGCIAEGNTDDGFENTDIENKFIGCKSEGNGTEWDLQTRTTFIANSLDFGQTTDPSGEFSTASKDSISDMIGNLGTSPVHNKIIMRMQNVHGSTIGGGKTVCWADADQAGAQFEALFVRGSDRVAGMLLISALDDGWESVQSEGFTSILQVNGTDDIAIGDELSLYNANAVAGLARDGDMVFAIALEAYTGDDSNGVIDAILVKKYKKGSGVPSGAIMMWSGTIANIPSGWLICDGNNGTPNLLDKFIIGVATAATNPADGGGSHTLTTTQGGSATGEGSGNPSNGPSHQTHTHTITATNVKHYRLAFIMKE